MDTFVLECFGIAYTIGKDIFVFLKNMKRENKLYGEEKRLVEHSWVEKYGIVQRFRDVDIEIRWTSPRKYEQRLHDGYEKIYEIDEKNKIRKYFIDSSDCILMGKMIDNDR